MLTNFNEFSLTSYYVDIMRDDIKLSSATCFFTKRNGRLYLITNWHVVSGLNADTFEGIDKMCAIPNKLRAYLPAKKSEDILEYDESNYCDFSLRDADDNPLWYEKELNNRMIDVAVLPCDSEPDLFYLPIEDAEEPFNEETNYQIASNIYIIGYPFANQFGYVPIWKQASVASEPEIDIEGLPYFFADTATKHGMSGSPVVLLENRPITLISNDKGYSRHKTKFVGIYSGRIGANSDSRNDAQLGRIWKAKVIQDIIEENE